MDETPLLTGSAVLRSAFQADFAPHGGATLQLYVSLMVSEQVYDDVYNRVRSLVRLQRRSWSRVAVSAACIWVKHG